jgi:tetratricopeptide (TPR) repeat protein
MASTYRAIQLFALRREQGRLEEVEPVLGRAAREMPAYRVLRCVLAHVYAELGREWEARQALESLGPRFDSLPVDDEWIFGMSLLPEVVAYLGDGDRAATLYELLLPYADRNAVSNPDACIGSVSRGLGICAAVGARWDEAVRHFEAALEMNARTGGRPSAARTALDYARTLAAREAPGDRDRAADLLASSGESARGLGMIRLESAASELLAELGAPDGTYPSAERSSLRPPSVFREEGEYWAIAFGGDSFRLKDSKGLGYLVQLLAEPGREFHALDLAIGEAGLDSAIRGPEAGLGASRAGDAGAVLDTHAKAAYRRRLSELEHTLDEALGLGDQERAARAREEMEFLARELANAVGLGGRDRRAASAAERARLSVSRAIRRAIARIAGHSRALGDHLASTIKTGTYCSYRPDPRLPISWQLR